MEDKNQSFSYTYSARQQEEIKSIRKKYVPAEEDKMSRLRALDRKVSQKAQAWAIGLGVLGTLVFGTGMSLAMTDLSGLSGMWKTALGIAAGIVGAVVLALAYPVYNRIVKKERQRIAPEILRLTDELLK